MADVQVANEANLAATVKWNKKRKGKRKSNGHVGPSPFEVPVVSVTMGDDEPSTSQYRGKPHKKEVSKWRKLKRRLTRKGVVPVNKDHPRYQLLSCIREGIRHVSSEPDQGPKDALGPEEFTRVIKKKIKFKGKEFEFESYASSVFATIRRSVGIEEDVYLRAVAPGNLPYLEFISNSKSGQDFFLSNDMQCMFKSNRPRDVRFFLMVLEDYLKHFIMYPHSLLVKYIGCYTIKFKGWPRRYFLVMQSIFFPSARIEDRFDVKGCTAGRYQKPNPPDSNVVTVLKDQNFLEEDLDFGDQGDWFRSQISADTEFLERHNCMDYSLLLGRQRRHETEKEPDRVATVVDRIGLSIHHTSNVRLRAPSMDSEFIDSDHSPPQSHRSNNSSRHNNNRSLELPPLRSSTRTNTKKYRTAQFFFKRDAFEMRNSENDNDDSDYDHDDEIESVATVSVSEMSHIKGSQSLKGGYSQTLSPHRMANIAESSMKQSSNTDDLVSPASRESVASTSTNPRSQEWLTSPALSATVIMPQVKPGLMFPRDLSDGVEKFRDENRRLLPKCQNRLHIIDGRDYRYFLGVVDFLTRFDWRQKMAQHWKMIKYRCGEHSTKSPDVYRRRFVDFLSGKVR